MLKPESIERMRTKFFENYKDNIFSLIRLTEAQNPFFENIKKNETTGYQKVTAPTLIMAGKHDRAVPLWMQKKLVNIFPNSRLHILPDCGHLTYLEESQIFWQNFRELIRNKTLNYELGCNQHLEYLTPGKTTKTVAIDL